MRRRTDPRRQPSRPAILDARDGELSAAIGEDMDGVADPPVAPGAGRLYRPTVSRTSCWVQTIAKAVGRSMSTIGSRRVCRSMGRRQSGTPNRRRQYRRRRVGHRQSPDRGGRSHPSREADQQWVRAGRPAVARPPDPIRQRPAPGTEKDQTRTRRARLGLGVIGTCAGLDPRAILGRHDMARVQRAPLPWGFTN